MLWWEVVGVIIFLGVIFFVGILCCYGIKVGGFFCLSLILVFVIVVFVYIIVCLLIVCGVYFFIFEEFFWKDVYLEKGKNGIVFFYYLKLYINFFDLRVIGVFCFNDKKEYVGYSVSMYESYEIVNLGFKVDDMIKVLICDFIYSSYELLLSNFMFDC